MAEQQEANKTLKQRDDRTVGETLDERILREQTLVNERRTMPGEQAPSARMRSPAERDRARAEAGKTPSEPDVAPVESQSVKKLSSASKPEKGEDA